MFGTRLVGKPIVFLYPEKQLQWCGLGWGLLRKAKRRCHCETHESKRRRRRSFWRRGFWSSAVWLKRKSKPIKRSRPPPLGRKTSPPRRVRGGGRNWCTASAYWVRKFQTCSRRRGTSGSACGLSLPPGQTHPSPNLRKIEKFPRLAPHPRALAQNIKPTHPYGPKWRCPLGSFGVETALQPQQIGLNYGGPTPHRREYV